MKHLSLILASSFLFSACSLAQELELWKLGVVERDWERITEAKRTPALQPTPQTLMQSKQIKETAVWDGFFGATIHEQDRADNVDLYGKEDEPKEEDRTQYRSPL